MAPPGEAAPSRHGRTPWQILTLRGAGTADIAVARAVHAYNKQHPYASAVELDEVRAKAPAKQSAKSVPYFDETVSMVKSASVLHATGGRQARFHPKRVLIRTCGRP